jgi:hypothetical protein
LVPKCSSFIHRLCHICIFLLNIDIEKIQVFFSSCFRHNGSMGIVHLITILVKLHFQALRNEFANTNEIFFILGTWKIWVMVVNNILPPTCIVIFANGLENGVISHVHLLWNNEFLSGDHSHSNVMCYVVLELMIQL